jgi:hypothetical protein
MAAKTAIKASEQRKLHAKSGNRCALCKAVLVEVKNQSSACVGENAHIYGEKPDAARYDKDQSDELVNSERNLIFLCCNCHKKIDTEIDSYPASQLFDLKTQHETWVVKTLTEQSVAYSYAEIEVLASFLTENSGSLSTISDYTILKINDKIEKNRLTDVQNFINMGLSGVSAIEAYVNRNPDTNFGNRLTNAMSARYHELKSQDMEPTDIFYSLWDMANGNHDEFNFKAAGLGILVYFFEKCEVFEK